MGMPKPVQLFHNRRLVEKQEDALVFRVPPEMIDRVSCVVEVDDAVKRNEVIEARPAGDVLVMYRIPVWLNDLGGLDAADWANTDNDRLSPVLMTGTSATSTCVSRLGGEQWSSYPRMGE